MYRSAIIATSLTLLAQSTGAAQGEAAARLVDSPLSAANLTSTALGLGVVLAVMLGLAWVVRRFVQVPGLSKGAVRILGGVSLGARERAVLLSVDKRRILVGIAPGQVRTLVDLGEDDSVPETLTDSAPQASGFAQQLGRLMRPDSQRSEGKPS